MSALKGKTERTAPPEITMHELSEGAVRPLFDVTLSADSPLAAALLPCPLRALEGLLSRLRETALAIEEEGGCPGVPSALDFSVILDGRMAGLNKEAMGVPGPTNILSFPGEPLGGLAELVLSSETLRRECLLYGQDPLTHLVRLTAHGFGHVCGFDHGPDMDAFTEKLEEGAAQWLRAQGGARV